MSNLHKPEGLLTYWTDEHRKAVRDIPEPTTYLAAQREAGYSEAGKFLDGRLMQVKGHSV